MGLKPFIAFLRAGEGFLDVVCVCKFIVAKLTWLAANKQLRRCVNLRCPRHPGASTIGSQLQDGD